MAKHTFKVKMDMFPGFYETAYENCDTSYYATQNELDYWGDLGVEGLTENDFDFNFADYEKEIVNGFIEVSNSDWYRPEIVKEFKYDHIWSPKYYNFHNDEIYAVAVLDTKWRSMMRKWMKDNKEWLTKRIREDWTSYDGFISFMSNDYDEWFEYIFKELDERYIGCMITYMMVRNERVSELRMSICMAVMEDICAESYVFPCTDEAKKKLEAVTTNW